MAPRSDDDDWDIWPLYVGSPGALHDLEDQEPLPRLYGMRSVSKAAAWAMAETPREAKRRHGVGFAGHVRVKRR